MGLPPTSSEPVVVIREGCPACAQEVREAPGVLVLSMTRTQGGEGGKLNPRANPFPIIVGKQSREDVVQAVERVLAGEPAAAVAGRAGLVMHHSYEGPQSLGLDDAIWAEVQRLAGLVRSGKRLFLRCGRGCCCPCDAEQLSCHAAAWQRVVTSVAAGGSAPVRQEAEMDPASDAVSRAGGKLLLDLFGGDQPVVTEAAAANGFVAARLDICLDAELGDISNDEVMSPWARECAAGRVASLKSDVPCQSFTCLRARPVQPGQAPAPPLRSRASLPGLPLSARMAVEVVLSALLSPRGRSTAVLAASVASPCEHSHTLFFVRHDGQRMSQRCVLFSAAAIASCLRRNFADLWSAEHCRLAHPSPCSNRARPPARACLRAASSSTRAWQPDQHTQPPLHPHKHPLATRFACGRLPTTPIDASSPLSCSPGISPTPY